MSSSSHRMPVIDALRAFAALSVLLTHFVSYFPMSDTVWDVFPGTFEWICDYGGMAVQAFLVIGGFLATRAMSPQGQALRVSPLPLIWRRYVRLVVPYMAAVSLSVIAVWIVDPVMDHEAIPARATLTQWLAHVSLLQNVLGFESLSAGVWYVAIDFQLFSVTALLLWLGRIRFVAPALVLTLAVISMFWFNRDDDWDNWALYFFGSYGLGAAAWWTSNRETRPVWLGVIALVTAAALVVEFRERLTIALVVALTLAISRRTGFLERWTDFRPLAFLGRISYSLFLVHFPVLLLANGLYTALGLSSAESAMAGLFLAFVASMTLATVFYRWVEAPSSSLTRGARPAPR